MCKRYVLLLLVLTLVLSSCGQHSPQYDWPTLTVSLPISGDSAEIERVNRALNVRLEEQLGMHVQILPYPGADELYKTLADGQQIDLSYCSTLDKVLELQRSDLLLPLDARIKTDGHEIAGALVLEQYDFSRIGGELYALPTNKEWVRVNGFEYNREIARQYGLDFSCVHSIEDLTPVFAALRAQTTQISPIAVVPGFIYFDQVDTLSDS